MIVCRLIRSDSYWAYGFTAEYAEVHRVNKISLRTFASSAVNFWWLFRIQPETESLEIGTFPFKTGTLPLETGMFLLKTGMMSLETGTFPFKTGMMSLGTGIFSF